jgi:hypothetical protein
MAVLAVLRKILEKNWRAGYDCLLLSHYGIIKFVYLSSCTDCSHMKELIAVKHVCFPGVTTHCGCILTVFLALQPIVVVF